MGYYEFPHTRNYDTDLGWVIKKINELDVLLNTLDIKLIEDTAKRLTHPRGREAFTTDCARIYIVEEDETEKNF